MEVTSAELFCSILSISFHRQLDHSCGKASLEKWAFLVLQIRSLNAQLTSFRLGSQGSRALASNRSKGARQHLDQDTPPRDEPPAQAHSPRTTALSDQHLIQVFYQLAVDRWKWWRDMGCSRPCSVGGQLEREQPPQATPNVAVRVGQRRLSFLSPSLAFDGPVNPSLS